MAASAMKPRRRLGIGILEPEWLARGLTIMACTMIACVSAGGCSPRPNDETPTEFAPAPSLSPTTTLVPVPEPSAVERPSWTEEPQGIGTPFSLKPGGKARIGPSPMQVEFPAILATVAQGPYLLYQDNSQSKVSYASMAADDRGILVASLDPLFDLRLAEGPWGRWLTGTAAVQSLELIDLQNQYALRAQGICSKREFSRSPEGGSVAYVCPPEVSQGTQVMTIEIISLNDMAYVQAISFQAEAGTYDPTIRWIREDAFLAFLGTRGEPCLISTSTRGMLCSAFLANKPILAASAEWIVVRKSRGQIGSVEVYPIDCLSDPDSCAPAIVLEGEEFSSSIFSPSPDNMRLGMVSGLGLNGQPIQVGYFDTKDWTRHDLDELSGDYVFVDWCPDSTCMVVAANDPKNALARAIYIDGTTRTYPGIKPFQVADLP